MATCQQNPNIFPENQKSAEAIPLVDLRVQILHQNIYRSEVLLSLCVEKELCLGKWHPKLVLSEGLLLYCLHKLEFASHASIPTFLPVTFSCNNPILFLVILMHLI